MSQTSDVSTVQSAVGSDHHFTLTRDVQSAMQLREAILQRFTHVAVITAIYQEQCRLATREMIEYQAMRERIAESAMSDHLLTWCTKCSKTLIQQNNSSFVLLEERCQAEGSTDVQKRYALHRVCSWCRTEAFDLHGTSKSDSSVNPQTTVSYAVYRAIRTDEGNGYMYLDSESNESSWQAIDAATTYLADEPIPITQLLSENQEIFQSFGCPPPLDADIRAVKSLRDVPK